MKDEKKEIICNECGFPINWEREPVILNNDIFSLTHLMANNCGTCGHQSDGWTIKKIRPLLEEYHKLGKQQERQKAIEEFSEAISSEVRNSNMTEEEYNEYNIYYNKLKPVIEKVKKRMLMEK